MAELVILYKNDILYYAFIKLAELQGKTEMMRRLGEIMDHGRWKVSDEKTCETRAWQRPWQFSQQYCHEQFLIPGNFDPKTYNFGPVIKSILVDYKMI